MPPGQGDPALSNLVASGQVRSRDCVRVTHNRSAQALDFFREVHGWDDEESNQPSRDLERVIPHRAIADSGHLESAS